MPEPVPIQPDMEFVREVMTSGGGDCKKCYQCATCSAVCTLSPDDAPFPRKQMIMAQWGLKDRLLGDPAIWLCHNCGDCTTHCPRGARPGDVFGALRNQAIQHFAFPGFMGKIASTPKLWPLLFLLPVIIFGAMVFFATNGHPGSAPEFADLFPQPVLEALFFTVSGLVGVAFLVGLMRFIKALRASGAEGKILAGLIPTAVDIFTHSRFAKCGGERARFIGHLLTFWGFVGLAFMGTVVGIGSMAGFMHTPLALTNPWKIFANVCAVVIVIGGVVLLVDRIKDPVKRAASTYFDWLFLLTLVGVILTGILSELLRLDRAAGSMYPVYFIHLVLIFVLFIYAPYTKFAHFLYRTVAMAAGKRP